MTPHEFISKWKPSTLKEQSGAQEHFIDLCRMLGQPTPAEADPHGEWYAFEKGAKKYDGSDGRADVWMKGHFAWEYKGKHKDLNAAYQQLLRYREALDNPPLLVVCDMERFQIHTNFTGTTKKVYEFSLADLADSAQLETLRALFTDPKRLRPGTRVEEVTEEAAREFASLAASMRGRGVEPRAAAHFLNRILFCLFAEDVGMLPRKLFERILAAGQRDLDTFESMLRELFSAMAKGGRFGVDEIHFFNGGLFADDHVIPLNHKEVAFLAKIARLDWSQIEPAIFGTLFERGLDPDKRSQLGAHYTDRQSILRVVEPVLMAPLRRAWEETKAEALTLIEKSRSAKSPAAETRYLKQARVAIQEFRKAHLDGVRVLDPACGSGNFLYIALEQLHELEKEALSLDADANWGQFTLNIRVGPHMVYGIETNLYAHELAQVTIWIGHFQWLIKNGFSFEKNPVLKPISTISCRDAILDLSDPTNPKEAIWPPADVVIGNPPFLGGKRMRSVLQDEYVDALFKVYDGRVPREADLVTYWFEKSRSAIEAGRLKRAGLLGTNSIRGGASRKVLERIRDTGQIFMAWDDEPWIVEGAAVRISLVGFDDGTEEQIRLDDEPVSTIYADLTAGTVADAGIDLTKARRLKENLGIAFMGDTKGGPFDIDGDLAREWLSLPLNPNGRPNSDVVRPWVNGMDITRRPRGKWIIDFGVDMTEQEAALYEAPFQYVLEHVKPMRAKNRRESYRRKWWIHVEPRPAMREALQGLERFIATPRVAKHRVFVWLREPTLPDSRIFSFAREDDYTFGIVQSRFHEVWSLRLGSWHGVGNDPVYNSSTVFETYPFPSPTDEQKHAVAITAESLARQRDAWLSPKDASSKALSKRTLTNLYNERPAWLTNAHAELDAAVAACYGWAVDLKDNDVLKSLLDLNLSRPAA